MRESIMENISFGNNLFYSVVTDMLCILRSGNIDLNELPTNHLDMLAGLNDFARRMCDNFDSGADCLYKRQQSFQNLTSLLASKDIFTTFMLNEIRGKSLSSFDIFVFNDLNNLAGIIDKIVIDSIKMIFYSYYGVINTSAIDIPSESDGNKFMEFLDNCQRDQSYFYRDYLQQLLMKIQY